MRKLTLPNAVLLEEAATLLDEGREVCFVPKGNSMLPFIRGGKDSVVLEKKATVEVGDIALVRLPERRYVLHRVVKAGPEEVVLMGDGNWKGQERCRPADVLGTVAYIVKGDRRIRPGKARFWALLRPFRRYILAIYRRILP